MKQYQKYKNNNITAQKHRVTVLDARDIFRRVKAIIAIYPSNYFDTKELE